MRPVKRFHTRLGLWLRHMAGDTSYLQTDRKQAQESGKDLVIILDGTMASLRPGKESNAGATFRLLRENINPMRRKLYYEPGLQWDGWRSASDLLTGRGIDRQIMRAYGWLASQYKPGDRIYFFGYSRGAYAVRSLAGMLNRIGLLRREYAAERYIRQAYRHYENNMGAHIPTFTAAHCHPQVRIEMIGVWDTVKALGWPIIGRFLTSSGTHHFHDHQPGATIARCYHALALDETRIAFAPVLWECPEDWCGIIEQLWFRGAHPDIGGQIGRQNTARPLANIPLVWMLEKAEQAGLTFPGGWKNRFPCDPRAPMIGTLTVTGCLFWLRKRRKWGQTKTENLHESVALSGGRRAALPKINRFALAFIKRRQKGSSSHAKRHAES